MNFINSLNDKYFTLNGVQYFRNYVSAVHGDKIELYNCYERKDVLIPLTGFSNFMVNGSVYLSADELQAELLDVTYSRLTIGDSSSIDQNNETRVISVGTLLVPESGYLPLPITTAIANKLNETPVTITAKQTPVVITAKLQSVPGIVKYTSKLLKYLFKPGKGNWGLDGTPITPAHFELISTENYLVQDLLSEPNAVIENLGSVPDGDFVAVANERLWDFSDSDAPTEVGIKTYYFSYETDGVLYFAQFIGAPGIYGDMSSKKFKIEDFTSSTDTRVTEIPNLEQVVAEGGNINISQLTNNGDGTSPYTTESNLNGLSISVNQAAAEMYFKNNEGITLSTISLGFLNNEGTTFYYNETNQKLQLKNDSGEILSEIPVNAFVSNLMQSVEFNGALPSKLEFKDASGNVVDSVEITISNIAALQSALNEKAPLVSPSFSGIPTAPTALQSDPSTNILTTTGFVRDAITASASNYLKLTGQTTQTVNGMVNVVGTSPGASSTLYEGGFLTTNSSGSMLILPSTIRRSDAANSSNLQITFLPITGGNKQIFVPNENGTLALTTDINNVIAQTITNGVTTSAPSQDAVFDALVLKQNNLVSGTNIKTIEGQTLLGSGNIDLSKTDVGLSNVDNTSDINKPVSIAQDAAINAKVENNLTASITIAPSKTVVNNALALKADENNAVHISGAAEIITSAKTFTQPVAYTNTNFDSSLSEFVTIKNKITTATGWARGLKVTNNADVNFVEFGVYGINQSLNYAYIGIGANPATSSPIFRVTATGIGIGLSGTNLPATGAVLDVNGTTRINTTAGTQGLIVTRGGNEGLEITPTTAGNGTITVANYDRTGLAYKPLVLAGSKIITNQGNVILETGNLNPTDTGEKLQVNGNERINGQLTVNTGTTPNTSAQIQSYWSNTVLDGYAGFFSTQRQGIAVTGSTVNTQDIDNLLYVSKSSTPLTGATTTSIFRILGSGNSIFGNNNTDTGEKLQVNGTSYFDGNSGFGIHTPLAPLHSYNKVSATSGYAGVFSSLRGGVGIFSSSATATDYLLTVGTASNPSAGSGVSQRFNVLANGNVIINNATDTSEKFQVTGDGKFTTNLKTPRLEFPFDAAQTASRAWTQRNDYSVKGDFVLGTFSDQTNLTFVPRFYVKPTGEVGINSTNPTKTFYVAGTGEYTGQLTIPDGTGAKSAVTLDQLNASVRSYKVYTALIQQSSTNAPTVTVLENTLGGTPAWAYTSVGSYTCVLTGAFPFNKTTAVLYGYNATVSTSNMQYRSRRSDDNTIAVVTNLGNSTTDGMLSSGSVIEIRVYN